MIVAAAGVELRGVVRKGEKVFLKKLVEAGSSGAKFRLGFLEPILRNKHLGEAPADFRVTARNYRQKQNLYKSAQDAGRQHFAKATDMNRTARSIAVC